MNRVLARFALSRSKEMLLELGAASVLGVVLVWHAYRTLSEPTPGAALHAAETGLALLVGAGAVGGLSARIACIFGVGNARTVALIGGAMGLFAAGMLSITSPLRFGSRCRDLGGRVIFDARGDHLDLCVRGGVPGNVYLPGVLWRAPWTGEVSRLGWLSAGLVGALLALGLRDRSARDPRLPTRILDALLLSPAAGLGSMPAVAGGGTVRGVVACANPTFWGETCGQLYPSTWTFQPGEWCARCLQTFTPCERHLDLRVVSLVSGDIEQLNGLERIDTNAWPRGEPMPPAPQLSGRERWATLGQVSLPDVLTVAQAIAVVLDLLPTLIAAESESVREAARLAAERGSRVAAWFWFGPVSRRLAVARPTRRVSLGIGTMRLADLAAQAPGEQMTLQLDIGLLPVEIRAASLRAGAPQSEATNSASALWVPVGPPGPLPGQPGAWLPRLEGDALRTWLSTERLLPEGARAGSRALPYGVWRKDRPPPPVDTPTPGSLDLVHLPLDNDEQGEPSGEPAVGSSLAEWAWMDLVHLEWLRQHALVLTTRPGGS